MKFKFLMSFYQDIVLVKASEEIEISRIVVPNELEENCLVFIKNQKFLSKLKDQIKATKIKATAIFDQKLWSGLSDEDKNFLSSSLHSISTTSNVPLCISHLSKPFYDKKFEGLQGAVDGRQMGTTDIHPSVVVSQGCFIGENVTIAENVILHSGVVIGSNVTIGANTVLYPNVVVNPFTVIGKSVRVHSNTTIGSDGFGYVFDKGVHHKIWHSGGVEIHDDVEIGSNCSIDMGAFTPTVIGAGTKIDNQVQVAHNVKIGKGCVLCGQAGVAGSAVLEDYVVLGGRVAVGPDSHLGMGTQCAGGAMINEGAVFPPKSVLGGHPAKDIKEWMRSVAWVRKNALKS
jgi:UDP-3-O-[3-hydroxymyristoyl] glucosamine N-acyltransferase